MKKLFDLVEEFKIVTNKISTLVKEENIESLDTEMLRRRELIEEFSLYDKKAVEEIFLENELKKDEDELFKLMEEKKEKFKNKLLETKNKKQANLQYSNIYKNRIHIFNKKI